MAKWRVNVIQTETWVVQYEIIADDKEKAPYLVPELLKLAGENALPVKGQERVDIQYGDPATFAVMEAEPLEKMEEAEFEKNKKRFTEHEYMGFSPIEEVEPSYENVGGEIQPTKVKNGLQKGRRY